MTNPFKKSDEKLTQMQTKVEQTKLIMLDNVGKAFDNEQQLGELDKKAERLKENAQQFDDGAKKLRQQQRNRYYKMLLCIIGFVIVIIGFILLGIYSRN
jgi:cell division protein FtsB